MKASHLECISFEAKYISPSPFELGSPLAFRAHSLYHPYDIVNFDPEQDYSGRFTAQTCVHSASNTALSNDEMSQTSIPRALLRAKGIYADPPLRSTMGAMHMIGESYAMSLSGYESSYEERAAAIAQLTLRAHGLMWGRGADPSVYPLWDEPDQAKRLAYWPHGNTVRKLHLALPFLDTDYRVIQYTPAVLRLDEVGDSDNTSFYSLWLPYTKRGVLWTNPGCDVLACDVEPLAETVVELLDGGESPDIEGITEWLEYCSVYDPREYMIDHFGRFIANKDNFTG